MAEREVIFEIKEHLGVIAKYNTGWSKELNLVSWNGQAPKYDIRDWDKEHERMGKGVTLHSREINKLVELYLSNKNKKVVEEAKKAESEKWNRIAGERHSHYSNDELSDAKAAIEASMQSMEDVAGNSGLEETLYSDGMVHEELSQETAPIIEDFQSINEETPF